MKTSLALLTAAAAGLLLTIPASAGAATVKYSAVINSEQEVPKTDSTTAGTADLDYDDVAKTLSGTIELNLAPGTKVVNQHIHKGLCGESGGIVRQLTPPGLNGTIVINPPITLSADEQKNLEDGALYLNIHTEKNQNGEVRGQIFKADSGKKCPSGTTSSDGGSNGATTDRPDSGTQPASSGDSGGCTTSGTGGGSGLLLGAGLAAALVIARRRKR